ncbi:MAG: hybrid sensor histidine kinase/response regulator [bacterium]
MGDLEPLTDTSNEADTNTDTALAFAEELEDVALQLSSLILDDTTATDVFIEQILAEYERLVMAAHLFDYSGIQQSCLWWQTFLQKTQQTAPDSLLTWWEQGALFTWIELTALSLRDPTAEHLALLQDTLLADTFPDTLPENLQTQLLLDLHQHSVDPFALDETFDEETDATVTTSAVSIPDEDENESKTDITVNEPTTETSSHHDHLHWDQDVHPELLSAFLQETPPQVTQAAEALRLWVNQPQQLSQKQHAARLIHTIKGACGVVGVHAIAQFAHQLEDVLDCELVAPLPHELAQCLIAAADGLETLFEHLLEQRGLPAHYPELLALLTDWHDRLLAEQERQIPQIVPDLASFDEPIITSDTLSDDALDQEPKPDGLDMMGDEPVSPPLSDNALGDKLDDKLAAVNETKVHEHHDSPTTTRQDNEPPSPKETYLQVSLSSVQRLLNLAGELITATNQLTDNAQQSLNLGKQLQQKDEQMRRMLDELGEHIDQQAKQQTQQQAQPPQIGDVPKQSSRTQWRMRQHTLLETYNDLHSSAGLLTEAVADNRELIQQLQQQTQHINEQIYQQQRLQRQLSETILKTRLVSVQSLLPRLERTVREICRQTQKQADIEISGENLEVDTEILQTLTAPLLHLLRNAVDHGIETVEERRHKGKPDRGRIQLHFAQHSNKIHLTLHDDGRGLDAEKIRQQAIQRGLIQAHTQLSHDELFRLIFQAGFTTRETVNEVSGRGVGMDVVRTAVEQQQGYIQLASTPEQGTTVHIQLPLTMISTNLLLVRSAGHLVAIPSNMIRQLLYISPDEHIQRKERWYIPYQEGLLTVLPLSHLLQWDSPPPDLTQGHTLLLIETEQKRYALHVDETLRPRDMVVKSLAPWLHHIQAIQGACLLANGQVAPVIDIQRLLLSLEKQSTNLEDGFLAPKTIQQNPISSNTAQKPRILIVDDSLSNRKSLALMIEKMGYATLTAVDGLRALQCLHEQRISMILTDLEMPRMNGLEMTQAIRIWPEQRHLPIVMITSRSTQRHRQLAEQAGVDNYLTKPIDHDTLKQQLQQWLSKPLAA